jgi:hypothetical protein
VSQRKINNFVEHSCIQANMIAADFHGSPIESKGNASFGAESCGSYPAAQLKESEPCDQSP